MKNAKKYVIFPITYLILELVEEYIAYKCDLIADPWMHTGVLMVSLVFGISILAFVLVPFFEGGLDTVHRTHKKHGPLAGFMVTLLIIAGLYFIYYFKVLHGIEGILPPFMLN
ncbi:MAG: hypothetical protein CUN55_16345 [Phototrophicales bacterium]|nr:MAG: hypothetical protein CUN55_16345 [Phototrophicales bacterium]